MKKIAFLGLSTMGTHMAANLAKHNFSITAWNRTADRPDELIAASAGVEIVDTVEQAVTNAEIVTTCVSYVQDVRSLLLGENSVVTYANKETLAINTIHSVPKKPIL